eukprot:Skav208069  [mRNA]  locus=scaffold936:227039:239353:- [translate_table: standard]
MTVWKPSVETVALRRLPKTVRGWQNFELKQAMKGGTAMHDPIYDLQTNKRGYDPNLYEYVGELPEVMTDAKLGHLQHMLESIPYLDCCERQQRCWDVKVDSPDGAGTTHATLHMDDRRGAMDDIHRLSFILAPGQLAPPTFDILVSQFVKNSWTFCDPQPCQ